MSVIEWLLDSDPSIRWQVKRDLIGESEASVARERLRVASEGWGARLLELEGADGHWGGAAFVPHAWISTMNTLQLLRDLGVDPASDPVRRAIGQVRDRCTWGQEFGDSPFFEGEVEPCINGRVLAIGAYFGEASDRLTDRLLQEQLSDGGWNCDAPHSQRSSFHTTICVLEGLLEYENAKGPRPDVTGARLRGQKYLLERRLFRSRSTGQIIGTDRKTGLKSAWTEMSFPTRWHYDILWGLDYLRRAGVAPDERIAEAVDLLAKKRDENGRWPLENPHQGAVRFEMEGRAGEPSRWNTLRALRVLRWAEDWRRKSALKSRARRIGISEATDGVGRERSSLLLIACGELERELDGDAPLFDGQINVIESEGAAVHERLVAEAGDGHRLFRLVSGVHDPGHPPERPTPPSHRARSRNSYLHQAAPPSLLALGAVLSVPITCSTSAG